MTWESLSGKERSQVRRWQIGMTVLAILCELVLAADWYAFAAVVPFISKDLALSSGEVGLAQGIFAVTYGIGMFVWSPLSRKVSARAMLLVGLAGTTAGMLAQVYVASYGQLIALRLLIGFFDAAIFIGNTKLIFGWFPKNQRGSIVGIILAAYSLAITLDFALGIPLTINYGWRVFFGVLAGITLAVAVADALIARNGPADIGLTGFSWEQPQKNPAAASLGSIFRSRWIVFGGLGIGACTFALSGTATWAIPAFITVQKMPVESAGLIGTLMGLSQVVFLTVGGYVSDRFVKANMVKLTALLAAVTGVAFYAATTTSVPFAGLMLLAATSGVAVFGGGAIFALLSEKYPDELASAAVGYAEVFGIGASFVAPWLMGLVIDATGGSFANAFLAFVVVEAALFVALVAIGRESSAAITPTGPVAAE